MNGQMNGRSFSYGVVIALAIAIAAGALFATLEPLLGSVIVLRLMIPAMGLAYLVCLVGRSVESTGRITTFAAWFIVSAATWFVGPTIPVYVLIHAGMLWLVRSLYFYSGMFPALLDLGLSVLSICAAIWAMTHSGSVFLATWCFFLVQALFAVIPPRFKARAPGGTAANDDDAFERARRRANAALKQLFTH